MSFCKTQAQPKKELELNHRGSSYKLTGSRKLRVEVLPISPLNYSAGSRTNAVRLFHAQKQLSVLKPKRRVLLRTPFTQLTKCLTLYRTMCYDEVSIIFFLPFCGLSVAGVSVGHEV